MLLNPFVPNDQKIIHVGLFMIIIPNVCAKPMKNRSGPELLKSYTAIHNLLSERGLAPKMHYLKNKCPTVLQKFMTAKDKRFQLVLPHLHRLNSA